MMAYRSRARQRGSVYLAVLGAAMMVTLIGVSGVLAARVQRRTAGVTLHAQEASLLAQSAIDLATYEIATNTNWRTAHTHGTWTAERELGGGTVAYRFLDDDGNLSNNAADAVTIVGRGKRGEAVRLVTARVAQTPRALGGSILTNGDAESGVSPWLSDAIVEMKQNTSQAHSGNQYLLVKNRTADTQGLRYGLTSQVKKDEVYEVDLWVRVGSGTATVEVELYTRNQWGTPEWSRITKTGVGTGWVQITGELTAKVAADGTLTLAELQIETSGSTADLWVDDVVLRPVTRRVDVAAGGWSSAVQ